MMTYARLVPFVILSLSVPSLASSVDEAAFRARFGAGVRLRLAPDTGYVEDLYGKALDLGSRAATDADFIAAARAFVADYGGLFGVDASELAEGRVMRLDLAAIGTSNKVGVEFAQATGDLLVRDASLVFVFDVEGRLLAVQNQMVPGASAVGHVPTLSLPQALATAAAEFGHPVTETLLSDLAIVADQRHQAALAYVIELRSSDLVNGAPVQERLTLDAHTGTLISRASTVHFTDLVGNVNGNATPGVLPDVSYNLPVLTPLEWAHGTSPVGDDDTDKNGDFTIVYSGGTPQPVTFDFGSDSPFVYVVNSSGAELTITQTVTPGVPSQFTFNTTKVEHDTAQVNAHVSVLRSRQFVKDVNPADTLVDYRVRANVSLGGSCNAYYDGSSINFYKNSGGCVNMAYSTVVAHELGHWYNDKYGSGNGGDGFGEGNADAWAVYAHDDRYVAADWAGPGTNIRDGENKKKYSSCGGCGSEVHECGKILMGALWKVRRNLNNTHGDTQGDLIADSLFVRWMEGYNDKTICDVIETHWLTLDDDDGNLLNGTPHFSDIDNGFREQNFPGYDLPTDCTTPVNYGTGSKGSYDIVPHITSINDPQIGASAFTMRGELTESNIPGFLAIGFAKATIKYNSATILVDVFSTYIAVPVMTTGLPLPGQGVAEVLATIPNDIGLDNIQFYAQYLFYDPGAKGGVSATEGLDAVICCGC